MNKKLFEMVKAKCKDTGLSEKYLKVITENVGGSVEDDSTDETEIEKAANQISDLAKEAQSEATRWVNKKEEKKPKEEKKDEPSKEEKEEKEEMKEESPEVAEMRKRLDELDKKEAQKARQSAIADAAKKHKIPEWRMKGLSVPDEEDPDAYMASIKQDLITQNLVPSDSEGAKAAMEKAVEESATSLLNSITAK